MRRLVQLVFLVAFLFLFLGALQGRIFFADILLRLNPFLLFATALASRHIHAPWLISLIVLASALFAGRIFCGYICPLGTLFDIIGGHSRHLPPSAVRIKYALLIFVFICCIFGVNFAGFIDPLALLTRTITFVLLPCAGGAVNLLLDALRPVANRLSFYNLSHLQLLQPVYSGALVSAIILCVLIGMNRYAHRFWCRCLCPLGALLAICSHTSLLRRRLTSLCTGCMECRGVCPVKAIDTDSASSSRYDCIMCRTCSLSCPESAIRFVPVPRVSSGDKKIQLSRRELLASITASMLSVFAVRATPFSRQAHSRLIRPPGAVPENLFLKRCIRCAQCMAVCPTNTLQPCFFETTIEALWTPRVFPRLASCDQTCALCTSVCPTGALRRLSLEEKKHAKIGTAFIDTDRCLVWAQHRLCFICDEQCPYNAIIFKWHEGERKPFVVDVKCNGCGMCEQQCPVQGDSAIIVTAHGEMRLVTGSYIEQARRLQLEFKEDPGQDRFIPDTLPCSDTTPPAMS